LSLLSLMSLLSLNKTNFCNNCTVISGGQQCNRIRVNFRFNRNQAKIWFVSYSRVIGEMVNNTTVISFFRVMNFLLTIPLLRRDCSFCLFIWCVFDFVSLFGLRASGRDERNQGVCYVGVRCVFL
jgi:hypothetical protein